MTYNSSVAGPGLMDADWKALQVCLVAPELVLHRCAIPTRENAILQR